MPNRERQRGEKKEKQGERDRSTILTRNWLRYGRGATERTGRNRKATFKRTRQKEGNLLQGNHTKRRQNAALAPNHAPRVSTPVLR